MRLWLGTRVLVSLFPTAGHTTLAQAVAARGARVISDLAAAGFVSAIVRRMRMQDLTAEAAGTIFHALDAWVGAICDRVTIAPTELAQADATIRRPDLSLRAPDALHPALTDRLGASCDRGMAAAADALAIPAVLA